MGSSGSGNFSDYPGTGSSKTGSSGGSGGGSSGDRCALAVDAPLEDVEHSDYFKAAGSPPPVGTTLTIEHRKRLVAVDANGQTVGNLPTRFNYLAACIASGWKYAGRVRASSGGPPVATVDADFAASPP